MCGCNGRVKKTSVAKASKKMCTTHSRARTSKDVDREMHTRRTQDGACAAACQGVGSGDLTARSRTRAHCVTGERRGRCAGGGHAALRVARVRILAQGGRGRGVGDEARDCACPCRALLLALVRAGGGQVPIVARIGKIAGSRGVSKACGRARNVGTKYELIRHNAVPQRCGTFIHVHTSH